MGGVPEPVADHVDRHGDGELRREPPEPEEQHDKDRHETTRQPATPTVRDEARPAVTGLLPVEEERNQKEDGAFERYRVVPARPSNAALTGRCKGKHKESH